MSLLPVTGWRARLRDASFRGIPFSVEQDEASFGRRVQIHDYPNRDKPFTEDLGRATRHLSITAYLVGDDYADKRDRLISAIETAGPGTLVHPFYGEMQGSIDGQVQVTHRADEGRMCRVVFQFVESGELSFPVAGMATGIQLSSSASLLDEAIVSVCAGLSLDGLADFLQNDILARGTAMLNTVTDVFNLVDNGVASAMGILKGTLSVMLVLPTAAVDFVHALQNAWRAGNRLVGDTSDLIMSVRTMTSVTVDAELAPKGIWGSDSGTVKTQKAQSNLIAAAIRVTAISEAVKTVAALPQPQVAASLSRQPSALTGTQTDPGASGTTQTDTITVSHPALDSVSKAESATATTANWDDLTEIRTALNAAIDREQLRTTDDTLFMALSNLRAFLNRDITVRLAQVERTALRTPQEVLPALVLAARWYDDAVRATEILNRNAISHPGFVPVRPLRGPAR